ncbi:MAG: leucine-rich repeat domain-containing protein, partial [Cyanobacteria bacterium J06621_12]
MSTNKRRGGYLATVEGVRKLKEAKRIKKYTYQQIAEAARETQDKVKRLFNPQWGDGQYKVGEEAVQAICNVLDLLPEEIVSDWYSLEGDRSQITISTSVEKHDPAYSKALERIKQAARDEVIMLNLASMELMELPVEIDQLNNITVLSLGGNSLSSLPPEIGHLTNLTILYLDRNSLNSLPSEIGQLTNLTVLYLDGNFLSSLPPEIGQLSNLIVLYLDGNSLSSLPPEIGQLSNLIEFYLDENCFRSLPSEIGQLSSLEVLNLNGNSFSSLPPEIGQLSNLKELYLNGNSLSSLPPEIGQLSNLTELYLNGNSLSSLPSEIGQLSSLKVLYLEENSLRNLPPEIEQLTNLTYLYLSGNSLPIPPEVIRKYDEPVTIINYYLSLQNNQQKPVHEAKMLLVGQGNVGKTCLRERLIRDGYDPTRNKTDGIDIEPWEIEVAGKQLQVNIWDFGGQEIMHSTHQ